MNSMLTKVIPFLFIALFFTACENVSNAGEKVKEALNTEESTPAEEKIEAEIDSEENSTSKETAPIEDETIYNIVKEKPMYPGGDSALNKYLNENMKYPQAAKDEGIEGRVWVLFVVDKKGNIKDAKVHRDIGGGCGEEALRLVKNMPAWIPGKHEGKPVNVNSKVPINFKL